MGNQRTRSRESRKRAGRPARSHAEPGKTRVPFIAANKCGVELESVAYCGKSQIISAGGAIAAIASQDLPAVLTATIEIGVARATRPPLSELRSPHAPAQNSHAMRVAISASDWRDADIDERLRVLEAQSIVMPRGVHGAAFSAVTVCDEQVFDPGYLAAQRLSGFDAAVWRSQSDPEWQVTFARARALELKMYLIVIDASRERVRGSRRRSTVRRSTAIASPRFRTIRFRTQQTLVAPGTDVREGLERASIDAV